MTLRQASATTTLTTQITQHYSALAVDAAHVVLGGTIYSLSDEWWGLTTVQREPRQAYTALANIYAAN